MRLVASMNTRNELGRYLRRSIPHLLTFCDEIRVQDDGSDDGTFEWLSEQEGVAVKRNTGLAWSENEGELHQSLLEWTLQGEPTHVLAIDADEFVPSGPQLREQIQEREGQTYSLRMCEVWQLGDPWWIRLDGGWRPHPVGIVYRLPAGGALGPDWRIWGRKLAGGRVPRIIRADQRAGRAQELGADILHVGWARAEEREGRHARYVELDGGRYHAAAHLESIMWPTEKVALAPYRHDLGPLADIQ